MKQWAYALCLTLSLALAGCGSSARNEAGEAGQTITGDANVTMGEAVKDVDAASEAAFGAAENSMEANATTPGNTAGNASDVIEE